MKNLTLISPLLLFLFWSCEKPEIQIDVPSCIKKKIENIQNGPVHNPATIVELWEYNGTDYYYFSADCCDQFSSLYDSDCNLVCAPDGGFSGQGDGNCIPGILNATKTLIWEDPR